MKLKIFLSSLVISLLLGASNLFAQPASSAERAKKQTEWMVENLNLDKDQVAKVTKVNVNFHEKLTQLRGNRGGDRNAMRAQMGEIRKEQQKELKKILSEEQFQKYQKLMAERSNNRRGNRQGQGSRQGNRQERPF